MENMQRTKNERWREQTAESMEIRQRLSKAIGGPMRSLVVVEVPANVAELVRTGLGRIIPQIPDLWLGRELTLLQHLIDRANEKGWRKEYPLMISKYYVS
ncbi:hypothetical protein U1Q18_026476 [Sarracenia purpurea var. burkii]